MIEEDIKKYFVSSKPTYNILKWLKSLNVVYDGITYDDLHKCIILTFPVMSDEFENEFINKIWSIFKTTNIETIESNRTETIDIRKCVYISYKPYDVILSPINLNTIKDDEISD